jgi:hypothetical protein
MASQRSGIGGNLMTIPFSGRIQTEETTENLHDAAIGWPDPKGRQPAGGGKSSDR